MILSCDSFYYNKANDHRFWRFIDGRKSYCEYRADAFVEWLNVGLLAGRQDKASVLELYSKKCDENLPNILF
jgi:hypothetical protein